MSFTWVWATARLLVSPGLFSVFWPFCRLDGLHSSSNFQVLQSLYYYFLRVFHTIISRWSFVGVWMRASLLSSLRLNSEFWLTSTMLSSGYSRLTLRFLTPPGSLPNLWGSFQAQHLQIVSPFPSCFMAYFSTVIFIIIFLLLLLFLSFNIWCLLNLRCSWHWPTCQCKQNRIYVLQPNRQHCHTRRSLSETSRQIHLPRKQRLINREGHRHTTDEGMDSYR